MKSAYEALVNFRNSPGVLTIIKDSERTLCWKKCVAILIDTTAPNLIHTRE